MDVSGTSSSRAQRLQDLLGLSDEELIRTLDASALELMSGELEHRPELGILLDLLADHEGQPLQRWVRTSGPHGVPVDLLAARDFPGFEAALDDLAQRGVVVTSSRTQPGARRPAKNQ